MRLDRDQWAMKMALLTAQRSTCCRGQVGCVLLNSKGHVLSTGYNGVAAGLPHCNEENVVGFVEPHDTPVIDHPFACHKWSTSSDGCEAIHAEQNALLQCRNIYDIHTCYTTLSPCLTCTKLLLNTGCQVIIYHDEYRCDKGLDLWRRAGRQIIKFSDIGKPFNTIVEETKAKMIADERDAVLREYHKKFGGK